MTERRFALCVGCGAVIKAGPYHVRRMRRHMATEAHNKPVVEWVTYRQYVDWLEINTRKPLDYKRGL